MGTYTSLEQYRKRLDRLSKDLKKVARDSPRDFAKLMVNRQKRAAPRKTGETIRGIKKRMLRSGKQDTNYVVESIVTGKGRTGFRQNMWTNKAKPYHKPRMYWNDYRPTPYGNGTHIPTAVPGWWNITNAKYKKDLMKITRRKTQKALRVSV